MIRSLVLFALAAVPLLCQGSGSDVGEAPLIFREDWTATAPSLPLTQRDVANPELAVTVHGPGAALIKKSFHDANDWDPHYIWSGLAQGNWAVSLSLRSGAVMDLSGPATVRWRSKQSGFRALRVVVGLADGSWMVSEESDPTSEEWRSREFSLASTRWRALDITQVSEGRWIERPDVSRVKSVGFTDLMRGGRSAACSRLDWIEVRGQSLVEGPTQMFILSGQSNMVGWGNSLELDGVSRFGHDSRVVTFDDGAWRNLRPSGDTSKQQRETWGITERTFGPEIGFAHTMAKAWPDQRIGIVKQAVGGTGIMAWAPRWNKADADLTSDAHKGSLYKKLIEKVKEARRSGEVEIRGFVWLQGGKDMIVMDTAERYRENLKTLIETLRRDLNLPELPVLVGTYRQAGIPDSFDGLDLGQFEYKSDKPRPGALTVMKAQTDVAQYLPHSMPVILRDLPTHPNNVHANTEGMLIAGRAFARVFLESFSD